MTVLSDYKRVVMAPMVRSYNATIASLRERIASDAKRIAELEAERDDLKADYLRRHKDACDRFEEVASLHRALAEERERHQWRTIDSAPKDRPFILAIEEDGEIEYHISKYAGADKQILVIGSSFAFDYGGKRLGWIEIQPIDATAIRSGEHEEM